MVIGQIGDIYGQISCVPIPQPGPGIRIAQKGLMSLNSSLTGRKSVHGKADYLGGILGTKHNLFCASLYNTSVQTLHMVHAIMVNLFI